MSKTSTGHGSSHAESGHIPVLAQEILDIFTPQPHHIYVDGTLGLGGHAAFFLSKEPTLRIVGFDLDQEHLSIAKAKLSPLTEHLTLVHDNFGNIGSHWGKDIPHEGIDLCLLDLGICSRHVDIPEKGFSFQQDGPLDMRFDKTQELDAARIINTYSEHDLAALLHTLGEEPLARKFARVIVEKREQAPITTTKQLADILYTASNKRHAGKHPATQSFQALRLAVNKELEGLQKGLDDILSLLNPGGILAVISYHSLEDRIVKTTFAYLCPKSKVNKYKVQETPPFSLLNKSPILPSKLEIKENPRSRSAKLRCIQKNIPS